MKIKLAIPKGRMYSKIIELLNDAGFYLSNGEANYRPLINDSEIEVKILKPQNIPQLVELGAHDLAFTGYDWVVESEADVTELADLKLDQGKVVAAIPDSNESGIEVLKKRKITVVSEYDKIAKDFLREENFDFVFVRSFGATEAFPPEDGDMIIDNTFTGETLRKNNLKIVKTILRTSTRLIANNESLKNSCKGKKISEIKTLLESVIEARNKVVLEVKVKGNNLKGILEFFPENNITVIELCNGQGKEFLISAVVERQLLRKLIPLLNSVGVEQVWEKKLEKLQMV